MVLSCVIVELMDCWYSAYGCSEVYLQASAPFQNVMPYRNRRCTAIACLVLFKIYTTVEEVCIILSTFSKEEVPLL